MAAIHPEQAPDIGEGFVYHGYSYVVSGWLRPTPQPVNPSPPDELDELLDGLLGDLVGRVRLSFCRREDATHVSGTGVSGCIASLSDIKLTGPAGLSIDHLDYLRSTADRLVDHPVI